MVVDDQAFAHTWQLFGYDVLDARGDKVGLVGRIWTDETTGILKFIGLRTGWVWRRTRTRVIPAGDAQVDDRARSIRVGYPAGTICGAPSHNTDVNLNSDQERKVYTYYDNP